MVESIWASFPAYRLKKFERSLKNKIETSFNKQFFIYKLRVESLNLLLVVPIINNTEEKKMLKAPKSHLPKISQM